MNSDSIELIPSVDLALLCRVVLGEEEEELEEDDKDKEVREASASRAGN